MKRISSAKVAGIKQRTESKAGSRRRGMVKTTRAEPAPVDIITVTPDEREHLIEDVAFFRAERYRRVDPGKYRKQDRREAEADIAEVFEEHGVR